MAGKQKGKASKVIGIGFKLSEAKDIERRADAMNISTSHYCKTIIRKHLTSGEKLIIEGE